MCYIALMHVKTKILKTVFSLLYIMIICCLFTLNEILTCGKSQLCTHNQSWDMVISISNKYCILCFIALIQVNMKIWKTALELL